MSGPQHRRPQPPVPDLELLVIDGDNLLHRVRGMRDEAGLHWLLPRLKAWRPAEVQILLMLDGSPGPGVGRRQQVVPGIQMQHSGRLDADTAIVELVRARGYAERTRTVVVTDDRQLRTAPDTRASSCGGWTGSSTCSPGPTRTPPWRSPHPAGVPVSARPGPRPRARASGRPPPAARWHRRRQATACTGRHDAHRTRPRRRRRAVEAGPWRDHQARQSRRQGRCARTRRLIRSRRLRYDTGVPAPDPWTTFLTG